MKVLCVFGTRPEAIKLAPVIRRTGAYQTRRVHGSDTLREISLELILMVLTRYGTSFDPVLAVMGEDHLPGPQRGPTLIIGPHTMLSTLFVRYLEDRGYAEIAAHGQLTEATVRKRVSRGLRVLRDRVGGNL